jgi:rare lipoprotein A
VGLVALAWLVACAGPSAELREGRLGTVEEGMATYYSPRLVGRRTANGERYDPAAMTAAHHALPLGTVVRVQRLNGPRTSVQVRINDRCAGRRKIIDLSDAAARRLDMMRAGIVPVRLEVIGMSHQTKASGSARGPTKARTSSSRSAK